MAIVVVLAATAAGCGGGDDDAAEDDLGTSDTSAAVTSGPVPSTAPGTTLAPTTLTLRITDVRLVNSEESDNGMRILLPSGVSSASVVLTGVPSPNRVINVCQASDLDRRQTGGSCRTPASGEAVTVALGAAASGVEIVQVGVTGTGPAANSSTVDEVTIRYAASSRELNVRLPQIAAGESGGRPTFGLTPASADGTYRATLTWTSIPVFGGTSVNGQLEVVQDGNVTQTQSGGAEVRLNGKLPAPGEAAIRLQNTGSASLVTPKLNVVLP
jgi:hypothetical protein